ncbi:MAG TPA: Gfo/Idh/MocA family oxidoreductase [bacterium]|nr:Gfo/Idh/MocA family oxidoreductase [bacterium]
MKRRLPWPGVGGDGNVRQQEPPDAQANLYGMMNPPRIGFIGCGRHATANLYPAIRLAGGQIVAVCARHLERAQATAALFGVPRAYDRVADLVGSDLDAVFVSTPEAEQAAVVADVVRMRRHVFVEKPLGLNAREAATIADLAAEVGVFVMVGFMKRFAPAYQEIRRAAQDTAFGERLALYGMFAIGSRQGWEDAWYLQTGAIHYVDLCRYLFGEVVDVSGMRNSRRTQLIQFITLRFEGGRIGTLFFAGVPAWGRHYEELTLTGVNGFVRAENMVRIISHIDRPTSPPRPRWQTLDEEDRVLTSVHTASSGGSQALYLNGYVGEVQHFLDCLRTHNPPQPSAADNVQTMTLCDRILRALDVRA